MQEVPVDLSGSDVQNLRELIERDRIKAVLYRYCRAADRADIKTMRSIYHPGAIEDHGPYKGTAEGFCNFAQQYFLAENGTSSGFVTSSHLLCNISIDFVAPSLAHVESYFLYTVQHIIGKNLGNGFIVGRYLDHFSKVCEIWAITKRRVVLDQYFEAPTEIVDKALAGSFIRGRIGSEDPVFDWNSR